MKHLFIVVFPDTQDLPDISSLPGADAVQIDVARTTPAWHL